MTNVEAIDLKSGYDFPVLLTQYGNQVGLTVEEIEKLYYAVEEQCKRFGNKNKTQ